MEQKEGGKDMKAEGRWDCLILTSENEEEIDLLDKLQKAIKNEIDCSDKFINDCMELTIDTYQ